MNYIVTTTNITKQYKDTTALNNVSIHIPTTCAEFGISSPFNPSG